MSYLGTLLELDEGSRLTGIGLRPLVSEISSRSGTIYMHVVMLPDGDNPRVASGAVATFVPATLATIDGNQPDGRTWFATFQLAADDRDSVWVERTADAAILRALSLTSLGGENVCGQALRADDLRAAYQHAGAGDVSEWAIPDLLTGLLIELSNTDLAAVVADADSPAPPEEGMTEHRRRRLHELLASWAVIYEGPIA